MKHENGYWIDLNGNRWSDCISESEAKKSSESLRGCINCSDCSNCCNCYGCRDCYGCNSCHESRYCHVCNKCCYCRHCYCCSKCNDCYGCRNCYDCFGCCEYIQTPATYLTKKIGPRTLFHYGDTAKGKSLQVVCGSFRGDLTEFKAAVMKQNADVFREQYLKEIRKVKVLFELEEESL